MTVKGTLLQTYREQLDVIEEAERMSNGYESTIATRTEDLAKQVAGFREKQAIENAAIAAAREEIIACRVGLQMRNPKTGTDLPPELNERVADPVPPSLAEVRAMFAGEEGEPDE